MANIEKNFDGKPIPNGYVLVPFEFNELEAEVNGYDAANVRLLTVADKTLKVIYKAVPKEWAAIAKSQFNLIQNEVLGHYAVPNSFSMDGTRDEFEWEFTVTESTEESIVAAEDKAENIAAFTVVMESLIQKSPQLGLATILDLLGKKGADFATEMGVTHTKANDYHQAARDLIKQGLLNIDVNSLKSRRSPRHDEYLAKAYQLLDELLEFFH